MEAMSADDAAFPTLDDVDLATLRRFGRVESVEQGRVLQREGDVPRDFHAVVSGSIDVGVRIDGREQVLRRHERGGFLGELSLLTGQRTYVEARMAEAGELIVVPQDAFRRMIATEPELSDTLLRAFVGRRTAMISMPASPLRILGSTFSPESLRLREFAVRNRIVHQWIDVETAPEWPTLMRLNAIHLGAAGGAGWGGGPPAGHPGCPVGAARAHDPVDPRAAVRPRRGGRGTGGPPPPGLPRGGGAVPPPRGGGRPRRGGPPPQHGRGIPLGF